MFDKAPAALLDDLHARGLEDDVMIGVWGEFGRTPKVNNQARRDHWPRVSMALLAGGGIVAITHYDQHAFFASLLVDRVRQPQFL